LVVGRGADAAATEYDVPAGKTALERGGDAVAIVGNEFRPRQLHAALGQELDQLGHVLVLAASRENFVADDDEAYAPCGFGGGRSHGDCTCRSWVAAACSAACWRN